MKRKNNCIILVNILFLNFFGFSQNPFLGETKDFNPNLFKDWQTEDLICKASKLTAVKYMQTEKFGEPVEIAIENLTVEFDKNGNYISKCLGNGNGGCSLDNESYEYYDGSSCLKSKKVNKYGKEPYYCTYECFNGLVKNATIYYDKIAEKKNVYHHDDAGNITKNELYNITRGSEDENIEYISIYQYNTNKQVVEIKTYNSQGNLIELFKFNYDLKGNLILREKYKHTYQTQLIESSKYFYDNKNNISREEFKYGMDSPGSKMNITWYDCIYNSNGTIKEVSKSSANYKWYTIKYVSYDNKGNWTQKIETNSSGKSFIVKRVIEY